VLRRCSFLTFPNAFKQCTPTLPIIHSAIHKAFLEKLPDCSNTWIPNAVFLVNDLPVKERMASVCWKGGCPPADIRVRDKTNQKNQDKAKSAIQLAGLDKRGK